MFRTGLVRSLFAVARVASKPATVVRCFSPLVTPTNGQLLRTVRSNAPLFRSFATGNLTSKEILARIDACGINDAGKEKVVADEVKKKNFSALREVGDVYVLERRMSDLDWLRNPRPRSWAFCATSRLLMRAICLASSQWAICTSSATGKRRCVLTSTFSNRDRL